MSKTETIEKVAAILEHAAETHHTVYAREDGLDKDWASWYADWLVAHSGLSEEIGVQPVRSELTYLLVLLDKEYVARAPEASWAQYYATGIVAHFLDNQSDSSTSVSGETKGEPN